MAFAAPLVFTMLPLLRVLLQPRPCVEESDAAACGARKCMGLRGRGGGALAFSETAAGGRPIRPALPSRVGCGLIEPSMVGHFASASADERPSDSSWWRKATGAAIVAASLAFAGIACFPGPATADADAVAAKSKIKMGGASTGDRGSKKNMTRGVVLDNQDFSNQDLSGVSFQQSIIRKAKFVNAKLENTSFFDANLEFTDLSGANMKGANLELARLQGAVLDNAVLTEMFVNGTTRMEPASIAGADFTDTPLRKDQQKYLCGIASGTNPVTKVSTKESLLCPE